MRFQTKTLSFKLIIIFIVSCYIILGSCISSKKNDFLILDMVHHNPGEELTKTSFTDPHKLVTYGYNGIVYNDFVFAHAALTFDKFDSTIFPVGSQERAWVDNASKKIRADIAAAKKAGLKVYYFTDILVLPKKLVEKYKSEICDSLGRVCFGRPKTIEIHRILIDELFAKFPDIDGLVIRTGETYLDNVPYHTGGNPITNEEQSHIQILELLREEVCVKWNKTLIYRTWNPAGYFHEDTGYYLTVTNAIKPHKNLVFSVKHTKGDYLRTNVFNPTLMIGNHPQIVEIQCQREVEGKGAFPNYIANGVLNGFEEYATNSIHDGYQCLNDIKNDPRFKGVWTWSRGGGWVGPYITNEFWPDINAYVLSKWAANPTLSEEAIFNELMTQMSLKGVSRDKFRELCLLSAKAIIRMHTSVRYPVDQAWPWWMRDEFLSGIDENNDAPKYASEGILYEMFNAYYDQNILLLSVEEKREAVAIWKRIVELSNEIELPDERTKDYLIVSSKYGYLLSQIIAEGWNVMALGFVGDKKGVYDKKIMKESIQRYYTYWTEFNKLKDENNQCATLYKPYAFVFKGPNYHGVLGMGASIEKYARILNEK